jgi:hypothetical protein
MKKNMGMADRLIRLSVAGALAGLFLGQVITGALGILALIVAAVFILTSAVNFCPLYKILGIKTCKN